MSLYAQLQRREAEGRPIRIGLIPEQAERSGLSPKLFNSFLDGSKPSIESAAVGPMPPGCRCRPMACGTRRPALRTSRW